MADIHSSERVIIDGFEPVSVNDIECTANITEEQANAMGAIFRAIGRMTDDKDIKALCEHGALQADLQANDLDSIREHASKAGLRASDVRYA
ncbi:hypothetical protein [Ralstonia holmesii]|uniref:hypothetical protein n=1 Tax=Ralstonia holmesii TaxID=3058602 RepID=UPI0028F50283|nr:hypothetical protein [Ralstonia sp. LMG 32967]CAJ0691581.1 hypothetical protein R11007_01566 [Ralstonia sp. LMG 32967]